VKYCDDCDWGHVFLYVDGVTGKNAEWFCRECGKKFTDAEVEKLDGEIDPLSKQRMGPNAKVDAPSGA
jgi:transposase-like protein